MADEPEDPKPSPAAPIVTPFTTSAWLAGIGRETLRSDTGTLRVAGIAREALISGVGLDGTASGKSSANGTLALTSGGVSLAGRARGASSLAVGFSVALATAPAVVIKAKSSARSPASVVTTLRSRITTESGAQLAPPGHRNILGRATGESSARAVLSAAAHLAGRIGATSKLENLPLPTRVNMVMQTMATSRASAFIPLPLTLPGGRITSRSRGSLYFAPRPPAPLGEAVSLNVG
jgi:hypothetical protein